MNKCALLILIPLALSPSAHSESLGRLFFTPAQRAALDQQRQLRLQTKREGDGSTTVLSMDGKVWRSSGRHTTWINGKPLDEASPRSDSLDTLKVGEAIQVESGERTDLLKGGRLAISRPTPVGRP